MLVWLEKPDNEDQDHKVPDKTSGFYPKTEEKSLKTFEKGTTTSNLHF